MEPEVESEPSGGQAEVAAQPSGESLVELAYDAIFVRDFVTRRIVHWNSGAERLYGWTTREALGRLAPELLQTQYPVPPESIESQLLVAGRWQGELRQRRRDGEEVIVSSRWALRRGEAGEPIDIVEVNCDVTALRHAQVRLAATEAPFRLFVQAVRDYAIFMLDVSGHIMTWNEGAQRIKGYTADEIIGQHFSIFYPEESKRAGKPAAELETAKREGRVEDEGWRLRKDGTPFWASIVITALRTPDGRLAGFGKVTRDLTERKRQEDERLELDQREIARLRQHAQRITELERAKAQLLTLASHELRGPLTVIAGYASMLSESPGPQREQISEHALPAITRKTEEMRQLIDEMLESTRLDESKLRLDLVIIDLGRLIASVVRAFAAELGRDHSLRVAATSEQVRVLGDDERITRILHNLLSNAVKYSPRGGEIEVRLEQDGRNALVRVTDQGIGIDEADLAQLFTRFGRIVTSSTSGIPGVGLGLHLSRELALMHGGDITVESKPGNGSTFTLSLPLLDQDAQTS